MFNLKISKSNDYFENDEKGFFYLADTLWTAFSNISLEEWDEYLEYRRMQGFNAFQANILTQWDGGKPDTGLYPFKVDTEGRFDFNSINDEYFNRAQIMLKIASSKGFIPVLVVLWGNYVKDTWMSNNNPINIMPLEKVKPYVEYAVKKFSPYNPIYIISGDTNFGSEQAIQYYMTAMKTIKEINKDALTTMHLGGGLSDIPEAFIKSEYYDFYMYQSSHNQESQSLSYTLAQDFYRKPVKRPILNGEPCYEGHAFGGKYGRYNEFHVRKAVWQSLLSGGKAGVTYGAHGLWGWYREGKEFSNEGYGGKPMPWRTALRFKGAWDVSFAKWIFETYSLFDLEPCDMILNDTKEIRMSVAKDTNKVVIYAPYNIDIKVDMDLRGYEFILINLNDKLFSKPIIKVENNVSVIKMHDFNSDVLILGIK
ncbi:MAG: hypothetical protein K0S55_1641 [Clostridia bacterium]|nr:hypothetical protein [Clostridia bacterium]